MEKRNRSFVKLCYQLYPVYFILGYLIAILSGVIMPVMVKVYSRFIDQAIASVGDKEVVKGLIYSFVVLALMKLYEYFNGFLTYQVKNQFRLRFAEKFTQSVLEKVSRLEYRKIEDSEVLALIHRVKRGIETVDSNISYTMEILCNIVGIIGLIFLLVKLGILNIILLFVVLAAVIFLCYLCANNHYRYVFDYSETDRKVDYIETLLTTKEIIPEAKVYHSLNFFQSIYIKNMNKSTEIWNSQIKKTRPVEEFLVPFIGDIFLITIYLVFLVPLHKGQFTIGFFLAILSSSLTITYFIVRELPMKAKSLFVFRKYVNDYISLMNLLEMPHKEERNPLEKIETIEFEDVYYKYPKTNEYVLKGLSFKLRAGNHYALIGENGAGKTTIIKLMMGLYKVTKGKIKINDLDISEFSTLQLSQALSVVFQNFSRYNITVKEFIMLDSNTEFDQQRADEIAKNLQLYSTIHNMEYGYDSILGKNWEKGTDLSGGQWQKMAIFRMLYHNKPVQILDEPTAALDPVSESNLYRLYENTSKLNTITLFISHRLASTKFVDDILLIKDGIVKERGLHSELIGLRGEYYKMFEAQKQWYLRDEVNYE